MEHRVRKRVRALKRQAGLKKSFLWKGPKGTCGCCDQPVDVWLASTLNAPPTRPWTASEAFLTEIYEAILRRTKDHEVAGAWRLYVKCASALVGDRHRKPPQQVYFVEVDGLAGPFCLKCLKNFMAKWEQPDGSQQDLRVYVVNTRHEALKKLFNSQINVKSGVDLDEDEVGCDLY
jgi:hypothetical protein